MVVEDVRQDPAVHVLAGGKAVAGEHRGGDVEKVGPLDRVAGPDVRAGGHEDAVVAMLLGGARGLVRDHRRAKVVRMETVVGDQHHGRVVVRVLQQLLEHHVVEDVPGVDDVPVDPEVVVADLLLLRRAILHEAVAVVVDRVVVDGREVPVLVLEEMGGGGVDGGALGRDLHDRGEPAVHGLVDVLAVRDERQEVRGPHLGRVHSKRGDLGHPFRRMDRIPLERPRVGWLLGDLVEEVRDHGPANGLGRVARPPADHDGSPVMLVQDVPDRLARPRGVGHRLDSLAIGSRLGEPVDAVLEGALPGGDGRPQHRRQGGLQGSQVARGSALDHLLEGRHPSLGHQLVDDLPVRGIPADQEELVRHVVRFAGVGGSGSTGSIRMESFTSGMESDRRDPA